MLEIVACVWLFFFFYQSAISKSPQLSTKGFMSMPFFNSFKTETGLLLLSEKQTPINYFLINNKICLKYSVSF